MQMWFFWPFLIGGFVLAFDESYDEFTTQLTPPESSTIEHETTSVEDNEIKVSFARGRPQQQHQQQQKKKETDEEENETDVKKAETTFPDSSTTLRSLVAEEANATAENETTSVKPNVKIRPQKMRRKRPFSHQRVFADRIFGKKYGQHRPKTVVNKLKHDLLQNATNEMSTDEPKSIGEEHLVSAKHKRNLRVWQSLVEEDEKSIPLTHGIIYHISKTEIEVEDKELPREDDSPVASVNETEETDLVEPPKKALLTYRQFVERRLSKLNRVIDPESRNEANTVEEDDQGSGQIGDLPDDHESAPLEENVLSVMPVP